MNTLTNPKVATTLHTLHEKAIADHNSRMQAKQTAAEKGSTFERSWATAYMAVNRDEGNFLYFLATVAKAKNIVEFGCSFGVSTIYLAAAAQDNGGCVITTDIEPNKVSGAKKNLEDAGLANIVEIIQGDAIQTLAFVENNIDFLFLDGAKELYLQVFEMLQPKMNKGAVIFADNADRPETRPFVDYVLQAKSQFISVQLFDNRALIAYIR